MASSPVSLMWDITKPSRANTHQTALSVAHEIITRPPNLASSLDDVTVSSHIAPTAHPLSVEVDGVLASLTEMIAASSTEPTMSRDTSPSTRPLSMEVDDVLGSLTETPRAPSTKPVAPRCVSPITYLLSMEVDDVLASLTEVVPASSTEPTITPLSMDVDDILASLTKFPCASSTKPVAPHCAPPVAPPLFVEVADVLASLTETVTASSTKPTITPLSMDVDDVLAALTEIPCASSTKPIIPCCVSPVRRPLSMEVDNVLTSLTETPGPSSTELLMPLCGPPITQALPMEIDDILASMIERVDSSSDARSLGYAIPHSPVNMDSLLRPILSEAVNSPVGPTEVIVGQNDSSRPAECCPPIPRQCSHSQITGAGPINLRKQGQGGTDVSSSDALLSSTVRRLLDNDGRRWSPLEASEEPGVHWSYDVRNLFATEIWFKRYHTFWNNPVIHWDLVDMPHGSLRLAKPRLMEREDLSVDSFLKILLQQKTVMVCYL